MSHTIYGGRSQQPSSVTLFGELRVGATKQRAINIVFVVLLLNDLTFSIKLYVSRGDCYKA